MQIICLYKKGMAGGLRSSRMRESVLEEGLRKGVRDMRDEMNVLIWKIERSRDISQEGMKVIVRKGFEAMAGAMEKVMNGVRSACKLRAQRTEYKSVFFHTT